MRAPSESHDLNLVDEWLAKHRLRASRFTPDELILGKTPDFRVYRGDRHVAYCEVKSPRNDLLDEKLDSSESFKIVGGSRPDPSFNRIAGHIEKAAKQFDAVNADRVLPNVLVLVNWADENSFSDLEEILTGHLTLRGGLRAPTMLKIADGRGIGERKHWIDLFVWIHGPSRCATGIFFGSSQKFEKEICDWFSVDPSLIERK